MTELPEITEIARWSIKPGDRLIVTVKSLYSMEQAEGIRERVRRALQLAEDFPVAVVDQSASLEVAET